MKKFKILVLGSFPAPYRVEVFKGISSVFQTDVFFATDIDQNRSKEFFVGKDFLRYYVITDKQDKKYYKECLRNIKQYNAVLAYDWYLPYAMKAEDKCIRYSIPFFVNCDGAFKPDEHSLKDWLKGKIKSYYIKNAEMCFASGVYASEYFKYYGAKEEKIVKHPFTSLHRSEIRTTPVSLEEKQEIKKRLGLKPMKTVLAIGQFIERKGFEALLDAWQQYDNTNQLLLIGGGELKRKYQKVITAHGYKNVTLIDFVSRKKIFEYYYLADLFVLPTKEDIWGLVVNEALAAGVPVISTERCIAALELIENGKNGYIVPANNSRQLGSAIGEFLYLSAEEYTKICNNAIISIKRYAIEDVIERHVKCIISALDC